MKRLTKIDASAVVKIAPQLLDDTPETLSEVGDQTTSEFEDETFWCDDWEEGEDDE